MFIFCVVCIILLILLYFYTTRNHSYWAKKNIKHDPLLPLFGNHLEKAFAMKSETQVADKIYYKYPYEKVVGYYSGNTPELIIRDPEIIKDILSVDFSYFYTRGAGKGAKEQVLTLNLFHADGDKWKLLRHRLTPAFTPSKLKNMFPLIVKCANKLHGLGDEIIKTGGECNVLDLMAKFTIEFIGACGLGIETDTLKSEDSFFLNLGKNTTSLSWKIVFLNSILDIFPETAGYIGLFDKELENVLIDTITKIFQKRNFKPTGRHDFVDLLLELSANGKIVGESIEEKNPDGSPKIIEIEMNLMCMIAQVFVFFAAGFETSSSSTSFTLYKLAQNPDIQMKIQKQIDEVLAKYDNKLCYDAVSELTLLDMAYKEALRMFPPLGILQRVCRKKYTIRQLGITIDPGVKIVIPVQAIQNDKQYYDHPDQYLPERWAAGDKKQTQKYVFMPFGEGPRNCIGSKLGHIQSLIGLATLLQRFTVELSTNTPKKLKINPRHYIAQGVTGGIPLRLKIRS